MSEFSESFHLRAGDAETVVLLLTSVQVDGYVFAAEGGWVSFVYEADEPPARDHFDSIVAAAPGLLVHYDYAEDHGCRVTVFDDGKRVARLSTSFDARKGAFDPDAFVKLGLMTERDAEQIATWVALGASGPAAAEALGLPHHQWLSFEYVAKAVARGSKLVGDPAFVSAEDADAALSDVLARGASETPWDTLAKGAVRKWTERGSIELAKGASVEALADALADLFSDQPSPAAIEAFLLDRDDVDEVFVTGAELVRALRD